jgi:xanthine dehydrogenase accessory factor
MVVTDHGRAIGTIGGGLLEARVLENAKTVLLSKVPLLIPFDMAHSDIASMDMICGGRLEVLLEAIDPGSPGAAVYEAWLQADRVSDPGLLIVALRLSGGELERVTHGVLQGRQVICGDLDLTPPALEALLRDHAGAASPRTVVCSNWVVLVESHLPAETVFVFGAGHVAQPTARLAKMVGFRVCVVDDRPEFANADRFPDADLIRVVAEFDSALEGLEIDRSGYVVILTRGHLHDRTVLMQALRTEAGYIGMIGSRRKREQVLHSLLEEGFSAADLNRVHSPIGIDIGAESCEEIAVSIVAELVHTRARRRGA